MVLWPKYMDRVTGFESFAVCPYAWKNVPVWGNWWLEMWLNVTMWDITHLAHQYPESAHRLCDMFFDVTYPQLFGKRDNILKKQLHNLIDLTKEWRDEYKDCEKEFEVKTTITINGVLCTWSYDCLVKEPDGHYHLFDYKTTSNIDYYNNWIEKKQVMFYAYFIMMAKEVDEVEVSYEIYVKSKNTDKVSRVRKTKWFYRYKHSQWKQIDYIDRIEEKVYHILDEYKTSQDWEYYEAKPINEDWSQNTHCWFCPLRSQEKAYELWVEMCPAKKDNATIDAEEDIEF